MCRERIKYVLPDPVQLAFRFSHRCPLNQRSDPSVKLIFSIKSTIDGCRIANISKIIHQLTKINF